MFDETVFNRIAANLATLNASVQELTSTIKGVERTKSIAQPVTQVKDIFQEINGFRRFHNIPNVVPMMEPMMEPTEPVDKRSMPIDEKGWPFPPFSFRFGNEEAFPTSKNVPHRG